MSAKRLQQDAYAEGFRAGLLRSQQAARLAKEVPAQRAARSKPQLSFTVWSHEAEPAALAAVADPMTLTNLDVVLRLAALAGEALAWCVADECARNPSLELPEADAGSCAAHALANLAVYEQSGSRRVPPAHVARADLRDGLEWLSAVHADFARPSFTRFYAVPDHELDAALSSGGALVRAFCSAASGLHKNLRALQLHVRQMRRARAERGATGGAPSAALATSSFDGHAHAPGPRSAAELEASVSALAARSDGEVTDTRPGQARLALLDQAARARSLAMQRDSLLSAELAAAAACDYGRAAALKGQADEAAEDAEDARVSAEARARRACERAAAAQRLLGSAQALELDAALARDYSGGAARIARSREQLEAMAREATEAADYTALVPAQLVPLELVRAAARSVDVRWAADGADLGAYPGPGGPRLPFEGVGAYVLQWAREDTLELRRPRGAAPKPPAQEGRVPATPADAAELWEALLALAPEARHPAVRRLFARSPLLLAADPPDGSSAGATTPLELFWLGAPASPAQPAARQPAGAGRHREAKTVAAPLELVRALAALNGSAEQRPADDATFSELAHGGEYRCPAGQLPLELERDGQPVPNAAALAPAGASTPAAGAAIGGAAGAPAPQPPLDAKPEGLVAFRVCRAAPLDPGVAYRMRVRAVSAADLEGIPSAELRCVTTSI